jgi:hypothetical protein
MVNKQQIFTLVNGRVSVKGIHVGLPIESAKKMLLEQSFTIDKEDVERGFNRQVQIYMIFS